MDFFDNPRNYWYLGCRKFRSFLTDQCYVHESHRKQRWLYSFSWKIKDPEKFKRLFWKILQLKSALINRSGLFLISSQATGQLHLTWWSWILFRHLTCSSIVHILNFSCAIKWSNVEFHQTSLHMHCCMTFNATHSSRHDWRLKM